MCNLYSHTKGPKAIRDLANAMGGDWLDNAGNLEPQPSIFPDGLRRSCAPAGRRARASKDAVGLPLPAARKE